MPKPAIRVENLWKEYAIGGIMGTPQTFREMLSGVITGPFQKKHGGSESTQNIWALRDVTFEVLPGEVVGIIGRNGAGKSTLLKILSRITEPTRGSVELRGRTSSLLEVGTGFHPELTGRENIFLNGAILGMSRREIQRKFDDIVEFAETGKFLDTPVKHYSSGMSIRLAFAVAAFLDSEIAIIDEVLAVGDVAFQRKCLNKIGGIARSGRTILLVSHSMSSIRGLCDRVIALRDGAIDFAGGVDAGIDRYLASNEGLATVEFDTAALPRTHGAPADSPAKITKVRLLTPTGNSIAMTGKRFGVELTFTVSNPCADVVLGWTVNNDEACLFETRSIDSYPPIANLSPGDYKVSAEIPELPLRSGNYMISVGLRDSKQTLDYLPYVASFRVENLAAVASHWLEHKLGLFDVRASWSQLRGHR